MKRTTKKTSGRNKLLRDLTKHYFPGQNLRVAPEKLESLLLTLVRDPKASKETQKHFFPTYNHALDLNLLLYLPRKTLIRLDKSKNSYVKVLLSEDPFWARRLQYELQVTFPIGKPSYRSYRDQYKILQYISSGHDQERLLVLDFGPGTLGFLEEKFKDRNLFTSADGLLSTYYILWCGSPWACELYIKDLPPNRPDYFSSLINDLVKESSSENLAWVLKEHREWADQIWKGVAESQSNSWRRYHNLKEIKWILSLIPPQYKEAYLRKAVNEYTDKFSFKFLYENYPEIVKNEKVLRRRLAHKLNFGDFDAVDFLLKNFPEFFKNPVLIYLSSDKTYEYLDKIGRLDLVDYDLVYKDLKDQPMKHTKVPDKTMLAFIETAAKRYYNGNIESALRKYKLFDHFYVLPEIYQEQLFALFALKVSEGFRRELITMKLRYEAKTTLKEKQAVKKVTSYYPMSPGEIEWAKKEAREIWE